MTALTNAMELKKMQQLVPHHGDTPPIDSEDNDGIEAEFKIPKEVLQSLALGGGPKPEQPPALMQPKKK